MAEAGGRKAARAWGGGRATSPVMVSEELGEEGSFSTKVGYEGLAGPQWEHHGGQCRLLRAK